MAESKILSFLPASVVSQGNGEVERNQDFLGQLNRLSYLADLPQAEWRSLKCVAGLRMIKLMVFGFRSNGIDAC